MGMTKALSEKLMRANSRIFIEGKTIFCATRYGNVAASRGSVIPLFIDQIKNNKPITITDKDMTRFLMTLDDSVDLVLSSIKKRQDRRHFVQKTSACRIIDLASYKNILESLNHQLKLLEHGMAKKNMKL